MCGVQLKSSLSKAFSRGRPRAKKTKSVRSAGEAWSDTETDDMLPGAETSGTGPGALSMPNSPSLNASRLRSTPCSPSTPSPSRNTALHSPPAAKLVAFITFFSN